MNRKLCIVIVAKDAAATIGRAAQSARACGDYPVLLVDDHSEDETSFIAQKILGDRLTIIKTKESSGVGNARQTAVDAVETPYAMWLDADDMALPHRADTMCAALEAGADLAFDPVILFDSSTGADMHPLPIPDFLRTSGGLWRSFERNWIPMLAGGFRTSVARQVGFDRQYRCAEDYDFLLRSLMAGVSVTILDSPGYRYAHSGQSLSRDLAVSERFTGAAQSKHELHTVAQRLTETRLGDGERFYTLACLAHTHADEDNLMVYTDALRQSQENIPPYNRSGQWMAHYLSATAFLKSERFGMALRELNAIQNQNSPDVLNNLALAYWHQSKPEAAVTLWQRALSLLPGYLDATNNLTAVRQGARPHAVTRFPLRLAPSRSLY
ncbi:glycosyltransferase [Kordiimonas sp.]|uniref:glycosyltransferase n=1 Tax=Kordiimonas sp. TaxID=1970157 RepID=UPI003A8D4B9F